MGRYGGYYGEEEELDRPDLNKCPDCNCFFAGEKCPLCGKVCPENMRAGNRAAVKPKKRKASSSSKVVYLNWYYSWWFILLMMLVFPLVGIILLVTSHHDKWKKILFCSIAAVYMLISFVGWSRVTSGLSDIFISPVDKSLTREEYVAQCEEVTLESILRAADGCEDDFVCVKVRVVEKVTYLDKNYIEKDYVCYLCEAVDGGEYRLIIRDCLLENQQRFVAGDVITVYGEGDGECCVYDFAYNYITAPCINMAYVVLE